MQGAAGVVSCGVGSSTLAAPSLWPTPPLPPTNRICPSPSPSLSQSPSPSHSSLRLRMRLRVRVRVRCTPTTSQPSPKPPLELKPPPYPFEALEPYMSRETVEYHWGRHHRSHVDSLNGILEGSELAEIEDLREMLITSYNKGDPLPAFIHAAQIWNHEFYWESMKPNGGGRPSGRLMQLIERDFGSLDAMFKEIKKAALTQFGSGWVWLTYKANRLGVGNDVNPRPSEKDKRLLVVKTPNAVNPLLWGYSPLLAIDVWEHAYYTDYENRREDYVSVFLEKLAAWDKVSARLERVMEQIEERESEEMLRKKRAEELARRKAVAPRPSKVGRR